MFALDSVPFSRYGSYLAFSILPGNRKNFAGKPGLYLRVLHGDSPAKEVLLIEVVDESGNTLPYEVEASPELLRLVNDSGILEICFCSTKSVRFRTSGVGMRLSRGSTVVVPQGRKRWILNVFSNLSRFILTSLAGDIKINALWSGVECPTVSIIGQPVAGQCEILLEESKIGLISRLGHATFETCVASVREEFEDFLAKCPSVPEAYTEELKLAAYVNWSSVVAPEGLIQRPAMLMSKNWMTNVWSWDHCFNAIALSYHNPKLAWDQLMCMFDLQSDNGQLPDSFNDQVTVWNFCKPPIHGWALRKIMDNTKYVDSKKLEEIYRPLQRWTEWWFEERDWNRNGIPEYHHGNDSGWDNSTVFLGELPMETPELAGFLVIQMEVLADIANKLGKEAEAIYWRKRALDLLQKLQEYFWIGDRFAAIDCHGKPVICDSLLLYIPIVLGKRLPSHIQQALVRGLQAESGILTKYGLATELPSSPYYESDGYWRGPIWAPATMLIVDGLAELGENEVVRKICTRFASMVAQNGFAENYDALTGQGLRDQAYTWTSSVFMILAHEYLN